MVTGIEASAAKAGGQWLSRELARNRRLAALLDGARTTIPVRNADEVIAGLSAAEVDALSSFLASPDFEQMALHLLVGQLHKGTTATDLHAALRDELRHGLRHHGVPPELTDILLDTLVVACAQAPSRLPDVEHGDATRNALLAASAAHVAATAARNSRLLERLGPLVDCHEQARRLSSQIHAAHALLRLPHTGAGRSVPWQELYVVPRLLAEREEEPSPPPPDQLAETGSRTVILGDPGAGKSTLITKLAHDTSRVAFLVVLRDFTETLRQGGRTLNEYLADVARDPYNVDLAPDTVEYLLLNGQAVVLLDGLDELTDVSLRRRLTQLVEAFVRLYPLVPVVVTSRRIGYHDAPLDRSLFQTCLISQFDDDEVGQYAANWFRLSDAVAPADRDRLRTAFLRESEPIRDLRSNPLLLSLLCSMYATEQYIPRNRAQVYERCALMVFERWDSSRGIPLPVEFEGKVRGAIQHLAWQMFTGTAELPRTKVLRILVEYLRSKQFDEDDARELATRLLTFCAGRAWVLVEVGATDVEPIYGFAHRTFMEYFVTEHLVRQNPTPAATWAVLEPHLGDSGWEVVAQLSLQLIDRNVDDGAEAMLNVALESHDPERLAFAARATGQVSLSPRLLTSLVNAAVDRSSSYPLDARFGFWPANYDEAIAADGPLYSLMYDSLRGNLEYIGRAVVDRVDRLLSAGDRVGFYLAQRLDGGYVALNPEASERWWRTATELRHRWRAAIEAQRTRESWGSVYTSWDSAAAIRDLVSARGIAPFYTCDVFIGGASSPAAVKVLLTDDDESRPAGPSVSATALRDCLLATPTPWLPATWWDELVGPSALPWLDLILLDARWPSEGNDLATFLIILLPYLETAYAKNHPLPTAVFGLTPRGEPHFASTARFLSLEDAGVAVATVDFLRRWSRREFNVIG